MSQLILDEQLDAGQVLVPLRKWITVQPLKELRPGEHLLDERVPAILQTLKQPTLVTIDHHFWDRHLCHPDYCILYFDLRDQKQKFIPNQLRALLHLSGFRTRAKRMGKVARIRDSGIDFWQFPPQNLQHLDW
jgi:hypothetical protein